MKSRQAVLGIAFAVQMVVIAQGQAIVPKRETGFPYGREGSCASPVQIDIFIDLLCPDCKAHWPIITSVADHYGAHLRLNAHIFPLPYHRAGWLAGKAAHLKNQHVSPNATTWAMSWAAKIFSVQEQFWNDPSMEKGDSTLLKELSSVAHSLGMDPDYFMTHMLKDDDVEMNTRVGWKYGCSRDVAGAPTYLVNGVFVDASSWDSAKWHTFIDQLLQ